MAHRSSVRLIALLAVLAIGVVLLARSFLLSDVSAGGEPLTTAAAEADAAPPARAAAKSLPEPAVETPPPVVPKTAGAEPEQGGDRAAAATPEDLELADAQWVTGSVQFPEGTPIGEVVEVVANGKKFKHRELHRAPVAPDGSFRVAFSKDTKSGRLALDAPHLFLSESPSFRVAEKSSGHVLEPELGGRIVGVVIPPDGVADPDAVLERASVQYYGWSRGGGSPAIRGAKLGKDRRFELRGIPAHLQSSVSCDTKAWTDESHGDLHVVPGEDVELEFRLRRGVHLSGKVVDEAGQPVVGASLSIEVDNPLGGGFNSRGQMNDGKTGAFDLPGLAPGKITLGASKKGFQDAELVVGTLADGDVREGLELRFSSGGFVAGRVVWPDGRPAEKAQVSASPATDDEDEWRYSAVPQFATAADGSFKITGLDRGPLTVSAYGKPPAEEAAKPEDASAEAKEPVAKKPSARGPKWSAKQEGVEIGSDSLVLTLQPGFALTGRVVDDTGAPVKRFSLFARPEVEREGYFPVLGAVSGRSSGDDGDFTLEGLSAGAWRLTVKAKGHVTGEGELVAVPERLALGTLVIPRASVLRGVVLGPDGAAAAKAVVELEVEGAERPWDIGGSNDWRVTANAKGQFEFKSAPIGSCTLKATRDGSAPSDPLEVSVAPGETLEGLALTLRRGGRLIVEVAAGAGKIAGREFNAHLTSEGYQWRQGRTDASGRATLEGLTAGKWRVSLQPADEELGGLEALEEQARWEMRASLEKHAQVDVAEGETAHVVLGAPPRAPVEVRGVVRRGGAPLPDAKVQASQHDEASGWQQKLALTDGQGVYRMTLDEPGRYTFSASSRNSRPTQSTEVDVPEVASFVHDIELSTGSISGRVLGPDGAPLAEASVQLVMERSAAETRASHFSGWMQTDESGAFRFDDLPGGVFSVTASGEGFGGELDSAEPLSNETVSGLELAEGGTLRDVTVRLRLGGIVKGRVRGGDGKPAPGVVVLFRNGSGALHQGGMGYTDEEGLYECRGLAPGDWTAQARGENEVSVESAPVRVTAGGTAQLDLELRPGTQLRVEVFERDGTPVGASLSVRDSRGRELPYWNSGDDDDEITTTVGPLSPGEYQITATNHDGVKANASVTVNGEPTKTVKLTLGG